MRIKAAMALAGLNGYRELAKRTDYEYGTLKALGATRDVGPRHLRDIAAACRLPYAWFTVPSIPEAVQDWADRHQGVIRPDDEPGPTDVERVDAAEHDDVASDTL